MVAESEQVLNWSSAWEVVGPGWLAGLGRSEWSLESYSLASLQVPFSLLPHLQNVNAPTNKNSYVLSSHAIPFMGADNL